MHSYRIFHADRRIRTPKSKFRIPNRPKFMILVAAMVRTRGGCTHRVGVPSAKGRTTGGVEETHWLPHACVTPKGLADLVPWQKHQIQSGIPPHPGAGIAIRTHMRG